MKKATIKWVDSASTAGWHDKPKAELFECETTGYLAHKDRKALVMCLNRTLSASSSPMGDAITIPMCAVRSIKYIR